MYGFQHESVAAERHDHGRLLQWAITVARDKAGVRLRCQCGRGGAERDPAGIEGQTRFRCSSTGMSRRTRAVTLWSMRAVAHPVPSETFAVTWPQGSTIMEWP